MTTTVAYIVISGLLGVAGQLVMKQALSRPISLRPDNVLDVAIALASNSLVVAGLAVYLSGTFLWLVALSRVDLSFAYPFASLNYIFVLIASWILLGEQPSPMRIAGVITICLGVWAISRTPAKTARTSKGVENVSLPHLGRHSG